MPVSAVISIGNELLLGRTVNSNMTWLASELAALGLPVEFSITVKDEAEAIRGALKQCWDSCDIVITTGGLGPTDDDITKRSIADFFGVELDFDDQVWEQVQKLFSARQLPTPEVNRNQALVPRGFLPLQNDFGTAPGLFFQQGSKCFLAFAGVPREMKHVFEAQAKRHLIDIYGSENAIAQTTLHSHGISESALAEVLAGFQPPRGVNLAWLPQTGRVDLRFYGRNAAAVEEAAQACFPLVREHLWGRDGDTPVSVLFDLLRRKGLTVSVSESCTGGLLQKLLTDPPGASEFCLGGIVAYSNSLKTDILGVRASTLDRHGAVSEECALEMARGIKTLTNSGLAISVTGVAGPDGGTELKPVGTVCFGFSFFEAEIGLTRLFTGDRPAIRLKSAEFAILQAIKVLQGK